ncbi:unnamed protein product [Sphagnum balticum]
MRKDSAFDADKYIRGGKFRSGVGDAGSCDFAASALPERLTRVLYIQQQGECHRNVKVYDEGDVEIFDEEIRVEPHLEGVDVGKEREP